MAHESAGAQERDPSSLCGIAGLIKLADGAPPIFDFELDLMNRLQAHRGPDGAGTWRSSDSTIGLAHRRLAIIDLSARGFQPMVAENGFVLVHNGEIYNHIELRNELSKSWRFKSDSDSEVIIAAYATWGDACVDRLRGMFAFAIWDPIRRRLFAARDRFGIKPFYYTFADGRFIFASEIKALLPFVAKAEIDPHGLTEYLTYQFTIGGTTLFKGVNALAPGHRICIENGKLLIAKYWKIRFEPDHTHDEAYFRNQLHAVMLDSIDQHLRADVPIGCYLSGGIDSTLIAALASRNGANNGDAFHGRFPGFPEYDESPHALAAARYSGKTLHQIEIKADDFIETIPDIIYHLDQPAAGPGSFPQYLVSGLAARHVKVVLGGQGADEIFAGYARYLIAYFAQALNAAIDDDHRNGRFDVTLESIMPNLRVLKGYKPLIEKFLRDGVIDAFDARYFRLVDRFSDLASEIVPEAIDHAHAFESYQSIFNDPESVPDGSYIDRMINFDLATLLPALMHVEDRVSMAHGLESRVPFVDHHVVELSARMPANVKFRNGQLKASLKEAFADALPRSILERQDKMGFPVPLSEWMSGKVGKYFSEILSTKSARERGLYNTKALLDSVSDAAQFSRKHWGLLCLELWHQIFIDRAHEFRSMLTNAENYPMRVVSENRNGTLREMQ